MRVINSLRATSAIAALTCGASSLAAEPQQAQSAVSAQNSRTKSVGPEQISSEDIVVTAQKRTQTLIDVPQAISVIGGDTLARQHATTFQDYLKLVPGLQLNQDTPGQGRLVIRGLNTGGVSSTVAVYIDETPFGSSSGLANGAVLAGDFDTFDVSRIEVLRGPQGTLYGASSLGGVLKFVNNAPDTTKIEARGRAGMEFTRGGEASYYGNAVLNLPLAEKLALRASGFYRTIGGFIDSIGTGGSRVRNDINDAKEYGGRASLLFKPSDRFSVRLDAVLQNIETDAPTVVESDPDTLRTRYGGLTQSIFVEPFRNVRYRVYDGTIDWNVGFANLISTTSYSTQRQPSRTDQTFPLSGVIKSIFDIPNELYQAQNTNLKKFTQEVRLASNGGGRLDWVVGGFYTHEDGLIFQQFVPVTPGTLEEITTLPLLAQVNLGSRYQEIAGFANATVHLGDHFDIDLGGRESHNRQRSSQTIAGAIIPPADLAQRSADDVFTWSAAPKVKFGRHASIYGRVAKGYRPGGPNALGPGAPSGSETFRSDSVINYEVGTKAETPNRVFSIEAAAYQIEWNNIQLLTSVSANGSMFNFNTNAGRARSRGVEITTTVRPTTGFAIALNAAYNHAFLREDAPAAVGAEAGDDLPFTPRYSLGANADYEWIVTGSTRASLGASLRSLSKQPGAFDPEYRAANGRQRQIPAYDVVDLRGGLDFGRFSVDAYVKNLTDSHGKLSTTTLRLYPDGAIGTGVIRPRTVGLSLTAGL